MYKIYREILTFFVGRFSQKWAKYRELSFQIREIHVSHSHVCNCGLYIHVFMFWHMNFIMF